MSRRNSDRVMEALAKDYLQCLGLLERSMDAFLRRYLVANGLPVVEEAIDETFVAIISGEPASEELQEIVQQYVDILASCEQIMQPFKLAISSKVLQMVASGLASEGMMIVRQLKKMGIRAMSLDSQIPELHQLGVVLRRACMQIDAVVPEAIEREGNIKPFLGDGRYKVNEEIGRGGFGVVYRVLDTKLRRDVAVKRLVGNANQPHMKAALRQLKKEAQILAGLPHQNIVQVFDLHVEDTDILMIMEYMPDSTLETLVEEGAFRDLSAGRKAEVLIGVCNGLAFAHSVGLLHLDLKPSNVLISKFGDDCIAKVADFGISVKLEPGEVSEAGKGIGTPLYMAPEQKAGSDGVLTSSADIYSLAKLICYSYTGAIGHYVDVNHESIPLLLQSELRNCLASDPAQRPETPNGILKALRDSTH
jgi:RIO-like serine/threonine protein kinase